MPFLNKLRRWAVERPDRVAVAVGAEALTWAQFLAAVEKAHSSAGPLRPVTAICEPNSVQLAVRFAAAVAGDGIGAVLDPAWPPGVRADVAERIDAFAATLPAQASAGPSAPPVDGAADATFLLGLTSGTSSVPKGFSRTRRSWQASFERSIDYFGLGNDDVTLAPGPMSASLNLYALTECLYAGTTFRALADFTPAAALRAVADDGVTRLVLVPTVLSLLAARGLAEDAGSGRAGEVRSIVCAGSAVDAATVAAAARWAPHASIFTYYGASELGFVAARRVSQATPAGSVGLPFPGTDVQIRDSDGRPAGEGAAGTIWVRSDLVADGYLWGDDGLAFATESGWCTVRDQGRIGADGQLQVLGRSSDMIVTSGHNVYPHEVERILARAGNANGEPEPVLWITAVPDPVRGRRVVAAVRAPGPAAVDLAALRAAARRLPRPARPCAYYLLTADPLTAAGKPSRALLAAWIEGGDPRVRQLS